MYEEAIYMYFFLFGENCDIWMPFFVCMFLNITLYMI